MLVVSIALIIEHAETAQRDVQKLSVCRWTTSLKPIWNGAMDERRQQVQFLLIRQNIQSE
jgi:hypothetical protein